MLCDPKIIVKCILRWCWFQVIHINAKMTFNSKAILLWIVTIEAPIEKKNVHDEKFDSTLTVIAGFQFIHLHFIRNIFKQFWQKPSQTFGT